MTSAMRIPAGLDWWRETAAGAAWLERLPEIVAACCSAWRLELGEPFEPATISYVASAVRDDGSPAVLKVNFPEPESEHEAGALAHWNGCGAARLLEHDDEHRALLVERCEPGTRLWQVSGDDEANAIAAGVLRRLWGPVPASHPFRLLSDEAEGWAEAIPIEWRRLGRPFERSLVDLAVGALHELGPSQREPVVLHQDFHGGNVLRATREPWLAIDPKPLVGEREFDTASLLRDRDLADDRASRLRIVRRLDQLSAELALDRSRMRLWGVAHALAWGATPSGWLPDMVVCARLLAAAR